MRFLRFVLFMVCLPVFVLARDEGFSKGPVPDWVKKEDFPVEPVEVKPSQVNFQNLLIDYQRNWEEKTRYYHYATKVLTQSGVHDISQLSIDFDPSYQRVIIHDIRVFRDGKWFDRLGNARHHLIQREKELEKNLYNGDLSAVYFLSDIRVGDILEYSYSRVGHHPLFTSHYTDFVYLQRYSSIERMVYRLLAHPNSSFLIKPVNTDIQPKIVDLSNALREWSWEVIDTSKYSYESDEPVWHNPPAQIQMSQYSSWQEVAQKITPLYTLPKGFKKSCPEEMLALVENWKASTKNVSKRALFALRFVQDEVRYLGIENGIGAFKPNSPQIVFEQRYGDCKDKTFLLYALLQLMDISSTPVLVHSKEGKMLPESLPSPFAFDHLVLQMEMDGYTFWVDPTTRLQGGSLQRNFFPDYEWGLLIANNTTALSSLPKTILKKPTEIETSIILTSEDSADLKIDSIFYASKANQIRSSLEWQGVKAISENNLSKIQKIYGEATINSPMEVLDDRENNVLTLTESYCIPSQQLSNKKTLEVFSITIRNYLNPHVNPERSSPLSLSYPLWVKEHIHIENPFNEWTPSGKDSIFDHESLFYSHIKQVRKKSADFYFELKHLQDHVPKTSLRDYWNIVNDIGYHAPIEMTVARAQVESSNSGKGSMPVAAIFPLALFIGVIVYIIKLKKRSLKDRIRNIR